MGVWMTAEKPKGPGYEDLIVRFDDMVERLTADFRAGRPLDWPVVPRSRLHRVWSDFARDGYVRDEEALENIFSCIRDNAVHLRLSTIAGGHESLDPETVFGDDIPPERMAAFCDWLVESGDGWRISDYGLEPIETAVALAFEARTPAARLKYLDRALHVTHQRGDLSKLFVEGGRRTVMALDEALEPAGVM